MAADPDITDFCVIRETSNGRGYLIVKGHVVRCWWCDYGERHPRAGGELNAGIESAERYRLIEFDGVGIA